MKGTSITDTAQWRFGKYHSRETRERWYLRTSRRYVNGIEQADLSGTFIISAAKFFFSLSFSLFRFPPVSSLFITFLYCLITLYVLSLDAAHPDNKNIAGPMLKKQLVYRHISHFLLTDNRRWYTAKNPWPRNDKILKYCHDSLTLSSFILHVFDYSGDPDFPASFQFPLPSQKKRNFIISCRRKRYRNKFTRSRYYVDL